MVSHQATLDEGQDATLETGDDLDVVGGDQHRGAPGGDVRKEVHDLPGRVLIEVAGGLVSDQKRGLGDNRPGEGNSLLLTA